MIEPFYMEDGIVVYHAKCEDVLPQLEVGSFAACITDPPYGESYVTNYRTWVTEHIARPIVGDDHIPVEIIGDLVPLIRDTGALYWFGTDDVITPFKIAATEAGLNERTTLVWDKGNWASGDLEGDWASRCEYIAWAAKGRHLLRGGRPNNLLAYAREVAATRVVYHSCQKPVSLMEKIIEHSTDPGDLILDPYMGSGSTLVAAKNMGRRCVGIELDEGHCVNATKRLAQGVFSF